VKYPLILADATNQDKQVVLVAEEVAELTMIEREIRQLILNLTRNGLEAMPSRGILKIMTFMVSNLKNCVPPKAFVQNTLGGFASVIYWTCREGNP